MEENSIFFNIKELEKALIIALEKMRPTEKEHMKKPTPTQMRVVDYILKNIDKEDLYQRNIEEALNLSKATVSDVLNRMEKNGLIERVYNVKDTRSKKIMLTEKARKMHNMNKKRFQEIAKKAKKNISQDEIENFLCTLNKMIVNLKDE